MSNETNTAEVGRNLKNFHFKGFMFSKVTKIFYTIKNGRLYRFSDVISTSSKKTTLKKWTESDYAGYEGNHKNWIEATEAQIEKYDLINAAKKQIKG